MSIPPTPRQLDLLRYIAGYQRANGGASPSYRECGMGLDIGYKSTIHRLISGLQERGLIWHGHGQKREFRLLVDVPVPAAPDGAPLYQVRIP